LFLCYALFKILWQIFQLFWILWSLLPKPDFILVQTPPAIPTLLVVQFVAWARSSKLIIDWHNLGYTILMLTTKKPDGALLISAAKWFERVCGRRAYTHITVTKALKEKLQTEWRVSGDVLVHYDRPAAMFRPYNETERAHFLRTGPLAISHPGISASLLNTSHRAALLVSSTSWTEDEDFDILLDAVQQYDSLFASPCSLPPIVLAITGKGPLRAYYENKITLMGMRNVTILTMWLAAEDYPRLLAASDIGISLHTSSSKLDLPMKIVDMLGAGLPVCALTYPTLSELLPLDGRRGLHFSSSLELLQLLKRLLQNLPKELQAIRNNIKQDMKNNTWDNEWEFSVAPIFRH
jgi:beta-1,4-mannosyltransferase